LYSSLLFQDGFEFDISFSKKKKNKTLKELVAEDEKNKAEGKEKGITILSSSSSSSSSFCCFSLC
jgi:hypothetical protein